MKLATRLLSLPVAGLTRAACWLALVALALMAGSVLVPRPLPVIVAMSVGHGVGALAFLCYLTAVIVDAAKARSSD